MTYICGVVEGFYGTPWTYSERKELFERLKLLELNMYMYAPKDDMKHRKQWRDTYTKLEIDVLKDLITTAQSNSVEFVYSLSPGLDIVFSSPQDNDALQEKLLQVYDVGCRSFAILFDDIDPELCLVDKLEFSSSADAQVTITNKLFDWFEDLNFTLFCPTEYCTTRAKPNIRSSEYLKTLGSKLNPKVQVMWTGPKVVSGTISSNSLEELTEVLKRKPLIWDNIHANDYDPRRVFLGPFKGRPLDLYKSTSGILSNPNCEYEANFVAIHSLSTWLGRAKHYSTEKISSEVDTQLTDKYNSNDALVKAVDSWLSLFRLNRGAVKGSFYNNEKTNFNLTVNSLVQSETSNDNLGDNGSEITENLGNNSNLNAELLATDSSIEDVVSPKKKAKSSCITAEDVLLLCDLFHLPYEHGERGRKIIIDFKWLKENAADYMKPINLEQVGIWSERAEKFKLLCQNVDDMFDRLQDISNRRLLQQLHSYAYDVRDAVRHLKSCVKWLGSEERKKGKGFLPVDPEPWFFRGGIVEEMERLLPMADYKKISETKVEVNKKEVHIIRPYLPQDKETLYQLCSHLSKSSYSFESKAELIGDGLLGPYIEYSSEYIFVVEVNEEICGFAVGHKNVNALNQSIQKEWISKMKEKYKLSSTNPSNWTQEDEAVNRLYQTKMTAPKEILEKCTGTLLMRLKPSMKQEDCVIQRLVKCLLSSLKTNVYCELTEELKNSDGKFFEEAGFDLMKIENRNTQLKSFFYTYNID